MDPTRFDTLARACSAGSRRWLLAMFLSGTSVLLGLDFTEARKKGKRKKKKRKKKPSPTPAVSPSPSPSATGCAPAEANEMLALVNAWRAQNGASALALDSVLLTVAASKSEAMARTGVFAHDVEGVSAAQNLADHGYPVTTTATAENISAGYGTAAATFDGWKTSPTHNRNMLNPAFGAMGVAVVRVPGRRSYPDYWTQTFGGLLTSPAASC